MPTIQSIRRIIIQDSMEKTWDEQCQQASQVSTVVGAHQKSPQESRYTDFSFLYFKNATEDN